MILTENGGEAERHNSIKRAAKEHGYCDGLDNGYAGNRVILLLDCHHIYVKPCKTNGTKY